MEQEGVRPHPACWMWWLMLGYGPKIYTVKVNS
eukprot:COSAG03_NODE_16689_length_394_cov_1.925424_1_plen_32_part_10